MNSPAGFNREKFCSDIRAERSRARLSQEEVGQKFGVSGVTISKWENGRYTFTAERFLALCFFFSLEPLNYMQTPSQKAVISEPLYGAITQEEQMNMAGYYRRVHGDIEQTPEWVEVPVDKLSGWDKFDQYFELDGGH